MNNILEQLRSDMDDAGRGAWHVGDDPVDACLEILEEFILAATVYNGPGTTVSVVTKELRERAAAALYHQWPRDQPYETLQEVIKDLWRSSVDATCDTVLGKTRVARKVLNGYLTETGGVVSVTDGRQDIGTLGLLAGPTTTIAILEDDDE